MTPAIEWAALAASLALIGAYELWIQHLRRTQPARVARTVHSDLRTRWALAIRAQPGHEILAVQTLRNSVMAASITASTAVLATVALVSQVVPLARETHSILLGERGIEGVLVVVLLAVLFAAFMLAAMSVRLFNHAGYMLGTPVRTDEIDLGAMGARYVSRAGDLYGLSLRAFLVAAPFAAGLANPLALPLAAIALVAVLRWYDRPLSFERTT